MQSFWSNRRRPLATALLLLLVAAVYVGWLMAFVDPRPHGELRQQLMPGELTVRGGETRIVWLPLAQPGETYSIRLTAAFVDGAEDVAFGLLLGAPEDYVAVTVSPVGYAAVARGETDIVPFAPFPHVHGGRIPNEIWVNREGKVLTVRLNREIYWVGESALGDQIGLVVRSYETAATIDFTAVALYFP